MNHGHTQPTDGQTGRERGGRLVRRVHKSSDCVAFWVTEVEVAPKAYLMIRLRFLGV